MTRGTVRAVLSGVLLGSTTAGAQVFAPVVNPPVVTMTVAAGREKPRELEAAESGLAIVKVNGIEYGFRPAIEDAKPWTRVTVTLFKLDPTTEQLGVVELKTGGPAVDSKTTPTFRISVSRVVESKVVDKP